MRAVRCRIPHSGDRDQGRGAGPSESLPHLGLLLKFYWFNKLSKSHTRRREHRSQDTEEA